MTSSRNVFAAAPAYGARGLWIALIVAGGVILSTCFACVTPFAALATLAALRLPPKERWAVIGFVWLANQAVGFGLLGYPLTWDCIGWGAAIGLSAAAAVLAAMALATARPAPLAVSLPFVAAFAAFEAGLYGAGRFLPAGADAFSARVIQHVFWVNAAAICAMIALHQAVSLVLPRSAPKSSQPFAAALQ